ncbi:uncharacterized protein C11orf16 homolog [Elgaria multicarinata webbii]|uniref:uncharacterized protein C11orf16 homolog n=1 Tax=Elgaria multicarinata webbii TaxID=159646 RepID=UPI002FCD0D48
MDDCTWSLNHKHCCALPIQAKSVHSHIIAHPRSILAHPTCVVRPLLTTRCSCLGYCPHFLTTTHEAAKTLEGSLDTAGVPVLARRETDGYYYRGTIVKGIEARKGTFLVQFATPFSVGEDTTCVQQTARSDIFEYVNGLRHSILPGDKVLAPWEPGQKRYGPGTVILGMETRDPLREKEDEVITVSFWNGKKAKVSLGVALWISPRQWERIIEMIHVPYTSRKTFEGQVHRANYYTCSCGPVTGSTYTCALGDLWRFQQPYCSFIYPRYSCFHHTCSLFGQTGYTSCCCPKCSGCWWQPSLAEIPQGNVNEEFSSKPTTQLLAVEGPPKEQAADDALSSSSSFSSDSQSGKQTCLTKSTMVDHAVNTDSSLFDQPKLQEMRRPDWKYWKRSHPSSHCNSQGANIFSSSCRNERAETKAVSYMDMSPTVLINQSAMFETIEQSPRRQLTVKDVLTHKDVKRSSGGD